MKKITVYILLCCCAFGSVAMGQMSKKQDPKPCLTCPPPDLAPDTATTCVLHGVLELTIDNVSDFDATWTGTHVILQWQDCKTNPELLDQYIFTRGIPAHSSTTIHVPLPQCISPPEKCVRLKVEVNSGFPMSVIKPIKEGGMGRTNNVKEWTCGCRPVFNKPNDQN